MCLSWLFNDFPLFVKWIVAYFLGFPLYFYSPVTFNTIYLSIAKKDRKSQELVRVPVTVKATKYAVLWHVSFDCGEDVNYLH